ncbi:MAG: SDR family NAD(P)-dependent oxidoreductase [Burkholderiales bacterium]|nr:SDR family NAD(P)-dependent oxidoreductase [Burkholderiales bacterium]
MRGDLFPLWQVDRQEYALACRHLGVEPVDALYERLVRHLAAAPFANPPPTGLARQLARPPLSAFRLARLDQASRWFFPGHPVRHLLNAALALHECHGPSYRALSRTVTGPAVWGAMAGWGLRHLAGAAVTLPWLAMRAAAWLLARPFAREADLRGRQVLITGVGRGLGRDLMLECLERGAAVVGTVRTPDAARALAAELPAAAPLRLLAADLAQPGALAAALRGSGVDPQALQMAVLCAGTKHAGADALDPATVRDTVQVNLLAGVELAQWFTGDGAGGAPGPAPDRRGAEPRRLVVVSSIGRWHGMHGSGGYNASKAALSIWAESAEMDLQRRAPGVFGVTVVEPGLFASGMVQSGGAVRGLLAPRRRVAAAILDGAAAGRRAIRPPWWFAALTWGVLLGGRRLRAYLFGRVKPPAPPA